MEESRIGDCDLYRPIAVQYLKAAEMHAKMQRDSR